MSRLLESLARRLGIIRPTQAYVISYPKSGRTWLRALIGKYLVESYGLPEISILDTELLTRKAGLWRTTMSHDGSEMVSPNRYTDLDPNKSNFAESRVLLLGRDIRDTLAGEMRREGIDLRVDTRVTAIGTGDGGLTLALDDGSSLETDLVMYATRRVPNTDGLGPQSVGGEAGGSGAGRGGRSAGGGRGPCAGRGQPRARP